MTNDTEVVVVQSDPGLVEVILTNTEIVTVNDAIPGPKGDKGDKGDPGNYVGLSIEEAAYVFTQSSPSSYWLINHPLPFAPTVTVVDSAGSVVEGSMRYITANQIEVVFSAPFSGTAYLS